MEWLSILGELVSMVGFPICAYLLSMKMISDKDAAAREDAKTHNEAIQNMMEKYMVLSESINNNTEAINNNTTVLATLVGEMHKEA